MPDVAIGRILASILVAATLGACAAGGPYDVEAEATALGVASGEPVLLALGFSNAHQEFEAYQKRVGTKVNRGIFQYRGYLLVNGAFGGMTTESWVAPAAFEKARRRIPGKSESSVRYVWFKIVHLGDTLLYRPDTTAFVQALAEDCGTAIRIMQDRYPALQKVFVSGRSYGGYAVDISTEPYARLSWKAVDLCVAGNAVAAPGPQLWDPSWPRSYFHPQDGRHLSGAGRAVAAAILDDFFQGVL